ncbi:MAG: biotin--[acetyl-CoA-carboxylase] ligase, partial [Thermoproteota archaeon]
AGMLVDASLESNKIENLVLGVGINFDVDVKQIEKILKDTPNFYGVASLSEQNKIIKPILLVQSFLIELEQIYNLLNTGDTKKIIRDWTKRSSTIGQNIELNTEDGKIKGKAIKIDDDGALVILENKKNRRITSGDITYLSK